MRPTTAILLDDVALIEQAAVIVIGWVTDLKTYVDPTTGRIWTLVGLNVDDVLKGPISLWSYRRLGWARLES